MYPASHGTKAMHSPSSTNNSIECELSSWAFNCKGAPQSFDYISNNIKDINFLSETWVKPGQLDLIEEIFKPVIGENGHFFSKCGMNEAPADYNGRPYGGVSFICKYNDFVSYQEIPCISDRVIALKVLSKSNIQIATVIGVYMPYFDKSTPSKTDEFIETLDSIQPIIDEFGHLGPILFKGDINVQLPARYQIKKDWHKGRGFNRHSKIMYDFLASNDLICQDMMFRQDINYTHFQFANNFYSYIDHVFTSSHVNLVVNDCMIMEHNEDNVSDHLPILTNFMIRLTQSELAPANTLNKSARFPRPNWDNYSIREKFSLIVDEKISELSTLDMSNVSPGSEDGLKILNNHIESFNNCLHTAAADLSHSKSHKQYKPKHFWCPFLNDLRDRKRFWWRLWCENGRPRSGHIYDIYKSCKKAFRHYFRSKSCESYNIRFSKLNSQFLQGRPTFWNLLRTRNKKSLSLNNDLSGFTNHYKNVMSEEGDLNPDQNLILNYVNEKYDNIKDEVIPITIDVATVRKHISKLKKRSAPGLDGITTEHLLYASSDSVCALLSRMYSAMLSFNIVPNVLRIGVIIPILKKPTLDVSVFSNYRPITLCSIYAKLLELMMIPECDISEGQYGYRKSKGADFCASMLSDLFSLYNNSGSPVYACSLDAEKCFDSIWHAGLLYKLYSKLNIIHWRFLFNWYSCLTGLVRVNNVDGDVFRITRGTRQGSILSPYIFNVFINDLLLELEESPCGLKIGKHKFNSLAYADDVNTFAAGTSDLQKLVDICFHYSRKWRFVFGIKKTKFFISGYKRLVINPILRLGDVQIPLTDSFEVLGKVFTQDGRSASHILERISKSRQALFGLGFNNEELCPSVKSHIWKSVGVSSLLYSVCTGPISPGELKMLESFQGQMVKSSLYLGKFSRHSKLLDVLGIDSISDMIDSQRLNLLRRVFSAPQSSYSVLCSELISKFYSNNVIPKGTLVGDIIELGYSPIKVAFSNHKIKLDKQTSQPDGLHDSIEYLLKQHIRPNDNNCLLLRELTRYS